MDLLSSKFSFFDAISCCWWSVYNFN